VWKEGVAHFVICCPPQNLLVLTGLEVHDVHVLLHLPPIYIYIMVAVLCKHFCLAVWERSMLPILPFVAFLKTCWLWLVCKCMMFPFTFFNFLGRVIYFIPPLGNVAWKKGNNLIITICLIWEGV
jgi:hypothetical protein